MPITTNSTSIPQGDSAFEKLFRRAVEERPELRSVFELHTNAIPNLNNPIHSLFRRSNFPTASLYEYEAMELAFRLASLWLTTDFLLEWWVHAAYDFEVPHPRRANKLVLQQGMEYNAAHITIVEAALANLAEFVAFDFDIFGEFVSCARSQWNETSREPIPNAHPFFQATNKKGKRVLVKLHTDFKIYARETFLSEPLDAQLRFSFYLATVVTHETCHAFSMMKRNSTEEPFFYPDVPRTDWGHAWEMQVLGGEMNPFHPSQMAPTVTLLASDWVDKKNQKRNGGLAQTVVPMNWIAKWFRRRFWIELRKGNDLRESPCCDLQVWQRADRRGSLVPNGIDLYIRRDSDATVASSASSASSDMEILHRRRGTKRKVEEKEDIDSEYGSAEPEEVDGACPRRKRPRADSDEEPVSPKTVKIDGS